jgi:hypothetical protein
VDIFFELVDSPSAPPEPLPRSQEQHEEWARELEAVVANPGDVWTCAPAGAAVAGLPKKWVLILPGPPEEAGDRGWATTFDPLIFRRAQQGYVAQVIYVEQISASPEPEDIWWYLQEQHTQGARWALLGGDNDLIPWTYENPNPWDEDWEIPNDWYYCDLDGEWPDYQDWAPELWVGRVPCTTPAEAEIFVDKVLTYEENPGYEDPDYLYGAFYEYSDEPQQWPTCDTLILLQDPAINPHTTLWGEWPDVYDPTEPYGWQVRNELNTNQYHYISIHGHGGHTMYATMTQGINQGTLGAFGPARIQELTNDGHYFFWNSCVCHNGRIDTNEGRCFAEHILCMYPSLGAVAFAGNTRWSDWHKAFKLQCFAWDLLFSQGLIFPGFNHAGRIEATSKYLHSLQYWSASWFWETRYSHNLFGDPATPIWVPRSMPGQKPLEADDGVRPARIELLTCIPNPTRDRASLTFRIDRPAPVWVGVYDLRGRLSQTLYDGPAGPGAQTQHWNCAELPPGVYAIQLEAEGMTQAQKAIVVR